MSVAVFLRDLADYWREADRISDIATEIQFDTAAVINALPFDAGSHEHRTSLMREIRLEGIDF